MTPTAQTYAPIDAAIAALTEGSRIWSHLTLGQRARLMERLHASVAAVAEEWADVASDLKGVPAGHPLRGEEWLGGPYAALASLRAYAKTLKTLENGGNPLDDVRVDEAPSGGLRAHVFPADLTDSLLLSGFTGEVWFRPGGSIDEARASAGLGQRDPTTPGGVGLVLGAGNVTSIPVLDVLYELLASNRVAILKVNPTMDPLVPVFERALAPLIEPGFVRVVTGGTEVGEYLTAHAGIDHVHVTGSAATFDAIVWGAGDEAHTRRADGAPRLRTPITSELGGVSPIIVVPGVWSDADLRFQAEHVTTMRLQNSGHNCVAAQVVILSSEWPQRDAFMAALRTAYAAAPARPVWYPRADEKLQAAASAYPAAEWFSDRSRAIVSLTPGDAASALEETEYFSPVLGVMPLPGVGQEFVDAAVAHANEKLMGTLGANILIDPATQRALGDGFERAIADLRYGSIAINAWTGFGYLTPALTWGAFPGSTLEEVGSGIGVVHNALLLEGVERSVCRGPFRPFPRSLGSMIRFLSVSKGSLLPKPPWFVTSRTGAEVSEGFTRFRMDGNIPRMMATLVSAFRA
ncbi:MAG TPA: aldehyde dehydrogenase family protein [Microbacterium sp.]|uniref:aldehyde dehydrogenase family protein n=1 Tax=Microbacterium sp. TaxID=51671 RepID=UPI002CAE6BD2|nr:aldehyde dehydrogenase family protein [Microbacterium sp.]HWI30003.1 aldehyde dehydrogenase family protein [Microbacterium sp.]